MNVTLGMPGWGLSKWKACSTPQRNAQPSGKQQGSCTLDGMPASDTAPQQNFCDSTASNVSSCTANGELRATHKRPSRQNKGLEVQAPAVAPSESSVPADLEWAHRVGYCVGELRHHGHAPSLRLPCSSSLCPRP